MRLLLPLCAMPLLWLAAWPFLGSRLGVVERFESNGERALVVALDGVDNATLDDWCARGWMPQLDALRSRSTRCSLRGNVDPALPAGLQPAVASALISTGYDGSDQGVEELSVPDSTGYAEVPIPSTERRLPTFWEVMSNFGLRVAVVGWENTWPSDWVEGTLVSDRFFLDRFDLGAFSSHEFPLRGGDLSPELHEADAHLTWPEELAGALDPRLRAMPWQEETLLQRWRQLLDGETDTVQRGHLDGLIAALEHDLLVLATLAELHRDQPFDLGTCALSSLIPAMSWYSSYAMPERWQKHPDSRVRAMVSPADIHRYGAILPELVSLLDRKIAELYTRIGEDAFLVLTSALSFDPPGPGAAVRRVDLDPLLEALGFLTRNADGTIDWSMTLAFDRSLKPFGLTRNVDLNYRGDFPQGVVDSDSGRERAQAWRPVVEAILSVKVDPPWAHPLEPERRRDTLVIDHKTLRPERWATQFFVYNAYPPQTRFRLPNGQVLGVEALFPLERFDARIREEGTLWMVSPIGTVSPGIDRLDPFGESASTRTRVAPTLLALFGIPIPDSMAQPRFDLLPRAIAQRSALALVSSAEFFLRCIGREDATTRSGARHRALRSELRERGWTSRPRSSALENSTTDRPPTVPAARIDRNDGAP